MAVPVVHLGCKGHFIAADSCSYGRHTQIGTFRISTVGDYWDPYGKRRTLGADTESFYETYVFRTTNQYVPDSEGGGCYEVKDWSEIDSKRYKTAGQAHEGHEAFIRKYLKKGRG